MTGKSKLISNTNRFNRFKDRLKRFVLEINLLLLNQNKNHLLVQNQFKCFAMLTIVHQIDWID